VKSQSQRALTIKILYGDDSCTTVSPIQHILKLCNCCIFNISQPLHPFTLVPPIPCLRGNIFFFQGKPKTRKQRVFVPEHPPLSLCRRPSLSPLKPPAALVLSLRSTAVHRRSLFVLSLSLSLSFELYMGSVIDFYGYGTNRKYGLSKI
jgi:hypothetical protein